jgi:lysophospholipase L1-like esterase
VKYKARSSMTAVGVAAALTMWMAAPAGAATTRSAPSGSTYYLALGDSLAQGEQPTPAGVDQETDQGYVDDIYSALLSTQPTLLVKKLGCPGETTGTMIKGGICNGPRASGRVLSQLTRAVDFLTKHAAQTSLITIDIGANNVDDCITGGTVNTTCVTDGIHTVEKQLPKILAAIRAVAPSVPIYAMNYYDPFLANYLAGGSGVTLAEESESSAVTFNSDLDSIYGTYNAQVADVQDTPFQTTDFTTTDNDMIDGNTVPDNVYDICAWTYMCVPSPQGPDIHANPTGYQMIADEFLSVIEPPS